MKTISFNLNFVEIQSLLTSIINIDKLMGVHDCSDQDYPRTPQEVKFAVAIELKAMGVLAYDLDNITDKPAIPWKTEDIRESGRTNTKPSG